MKTLTIFIILGTSLFGSSLTANAQQEKPKVWMLSEALSRATQENPAIRSSAARVEIQKSLKGASWDLDKTGIGYEYGQLNSLHNDNSITISQSFAFPTVYLNQQKLAQANIRSSELDLSISRNRLANEVKSTWWQLVFFKSKLKLLLYQDSLYTGFLRAATRRAETGETTKLEQISAESQSFEIKNQINQTKADVKIYLRRLQTLLNLTSTFEIVDSVLVKLSLPASLDSSAILANPSLASSLQQVEIARREKQVERAKFLPDFNVGYFSQSIIGEQDVNGIPRNFSSGDRFTGITAGVAIPLWFKPNTARSKALKINQEIAANNAGYFQVALKGEFESLLQEYRKYSGSIDYYEKSALPQADLIITQSTKSYRLGNMDYLEYILSLSRALQVKNNYLETLNQYNHAILALEFIIGKEN